MNAPEKKSTIRKRRARCKMCLESREVEVDTWDDRIEPTFEHDCGSKGPRLSHPVTRSGAPIPFFPIGDRVVVERLPTDTMIGGLHVPETSQAQQQYATVIAAGPQAQGVLDDAGICIGDTISFAKYSGIDWKWVPKGGGAMDELRVDIINIKDIQGCSQLAEKMVRGELGISLHTHDGGRTEYRFFKEVKETSNG